VRAGLNFKLPARRCSHTSRVVGNREQDMSDGNKCPMGKHPWLATFLVITFLLIFAAHKLGFL
jgi:hypothetical protein